VIDPTDPPALLNLLPPAVPPEPDPVPDPDPEPEPEPGDEKDVLELGLKGKVGGI